MTLDLGLRSYFSAFFFSYIFFSPAPKNTHSPFPSFFIPKSAPPQGIPGRFVAKQCLQRQEPPPAPLRGLTAPLLLGPFPPIRRIPPPASPRSGCFASLPSIPSLCFSTSSLLWALFFLSSPHFLFSSPIYTSIRAGTAPRSAASHFFYVLLCYLPLFSSPLLYPDFPLLFSIFLLSYFLSSFFPIFFFFPIFYLLFFSYFLLFSYFLSFSLLFFSIFSFHVFFLYFFLFFCFLSSVFLLFFLHFSSFLPFLLYFPTAFFYTFFIFYLLSSIFFFSIFYFSSIFSHFLFSNFLLFFLFLFFFFLFSLFFLFFTFYSSLLFFFLFFLFFFHFSPLFFLFSNLLFFLAFFSIFLLFSILPFYLLSFSIFYFFYFLLFYFFLFSLPFLLFFFLLFPIFLFSYFLLISIFLSPPLFSPLSLFFLPITFSFLFPLFPPLLHFGHHCLFFSCFHFLLTSAFCPGAPRAVGTKKSFFLLYISPPCLVAASALPLPAPKSQIFLQRPQNSAAGDQSASPPAATFWVKNAAFWPCRHGVGVGPRRREAAAHLALKLLPIPHRHPFFSILLTSPFPLHSPFLLLPSIFSQSHLSLQNFTF
ncbi:hypothetical protein CIB84_013535 [Bambusicola thoracicus]|uniref:Uncharacterized protein n=1 Tax=Bambusicola thoracicus TaxID=9083 RepID=A0A2P4SF68_BAMTH|nr:hypothetical protein CIB84_013535 [Bambusicola thoracicus]